ncbi:MAG: DUF5777 family beta-barrel protein [Leptospiraceae bacterium]|nr:DUF5777 family beta-barrel protein [Leptospiraceae bacterium]
MKFLVLLLLFFSQIFSEEKPTQITGTSLIHLPSTTPVERGSLEFRFHHRFGNAKSTSYDFLGLDNGAINFLSLQYGVTDRFSIGLSRISTNKTYEVYSKYQILTQDMWKWLPFNLSLLGVAAQETLKQIYVYGPYVFPPSTGNSTLDAKIRSELNEYETSDSDRRSYLAALLISKDWSYLFFQISPIYVHRNFVKSNLSNDRLGLDISTKIKISKRMGFILATILTPKRDYKGDDYKKEDSKSDYNLIQLTATEINNLAWNSENLAIIYVRNVLLDKKVEYYYVPFSFGLEWETSGHIFQIFITNNRTLAYTQVLRGADFDYFKKDWTLGFNIHRDFEISD